MSDVLAVLSTLTVAPEHLGAPAYNRDQWNHWLDADRDGCDTRDEVLIVGAVVAPTVSGGCSLVGGQWVSPYDGLPTNSASTLDIDHRVALAEAHRSGGWEWDAAKKAAYANDLGDGRTLVAVTASVNRSKGDKDAAGWLPQQDVCGYVSDWIAVKARWSLAVDAEEATKLSDLIVGQCAGATVASGSSPTSPPSATSPPAPATTAAPSSPGGAPYANCAAARAAGAAPVRAGDPGYGRHLDRDGDGIGCE
jgi:hypothetical protein